VRRVVRAVAVVLLVLLGAACGTGTDGSAPPRSPDPHAGEVESYSPGRGFEPSAPSSLGPDMAPLASALPNYSWGMATPSAWYFLDGPRRLIALDAGSGEELWSAELGAPGSPTTGDDTPEVEASADGLYVTFETTGGGSVEHVEFLDPATGSVRGSLALPDGQRANFLADGVLVASSTNAVTGYAVPSGEPIWSIPGTWVVERPGGRVVLTSTADPAGGAAVEVVLIDVATGAERWHVEVAHPDPPADAQDALQDAAFGADEVFATETAVVLTFGRFLSARNPETGAELWSAEHGLTNVVDLYPLDPTRIGITGFDSGGRYAAEVFDTVQRATVTTVNAPGSTGGAWAVRLDGRVHVVFAPDGDVPVVLDRDGVAGRGSTPLVGSGNAAMSGDRLITLSGGELTSHTLPGLVPEWTMPIQGAANLGFVLPDAVAVDLVDSVSVFGRTGGS
jgi:outer membrane protein assembly factor BamB